MASPAPACLQALVDASSRWPGRNKASDGIMGDAAHQARPSDHNLGNAFDITHDPASGCDGSIIARGAQEDARTKYIIWDRRIWSRARAGEGWRKYDGANPHTHHCHVSIEASARDDVSPWPWALSRQVSRERAAGSAIAIALLALSGAWGIARALGKV